LLSSNVKSRIEIKQLSQGGEVKIQEIIKGKRVEVILPSANIQELVTILNTHHVGALVVSRDGKKIDGIVSERDVVRAMPGQLNDLVNMHVLDIMTEQVHTCTVDATVAELMTMMTDLRIRHIPVVELDGTLLSIISIGDVVKHYVSELDFERKVLQEYVETSR
jgi:CBS domain-containing protein